MIGVGLYIEESLQEITARFRAEVTRKLGMRDSSLRLAGPILLRDVARSVGRADSAHEPWRRAIVLIPSQPEKGIRGLVREFGELRAAIWDTMAAQGHAAPRTERAYVDRMLDEALAAAAERWATMVRLLPISQAASPPEAERIPRLRLRPPAPPRTRPRTVPPPLPKVPGPTHGSDGRH